jgi:hypothetical protein
LGGTVPAEQAERKHRLDRIFKHSPVARAMRELLLLGRPWREYLKLSDN